VVKLNGTALPSTFVSATQVTGQVSAAQIAAVGQFNVTVVNPDGTASNPQTLGVVAGPSISSIDPAIVTADNSQFTLVVSGSAFTPESVVRLDGTTLDSTFVNSGRLEAHVPWSGYTTGADGCFVLFFDDLKERTQSITLVATHPRFSTPTTANVIVQRGATVSIEIDMS
jgi:hypothetical protein